jgi:integrase
MPQKLPWNKGKLVGQKAPFRPRDVQTIKQLLENAGNLRDLALFSVGIDTMLRGIDLLALRVDDVMDHRGVIVEQFSIGQRKTGKTTVVALLPYSRRVLHGWIAASGKLP